MHISKDSGEIIKLILPKFKDCMAYKHQNKSFLNSLNKMLMTLYNDIYVGDKFVNHKLETGCMKAILKPLGVG